MAEPSTSVTMEPAGLPESSLRKPGLSASVPLLLLQVAAWVVLLPPHHVLVGVWKAARPWSDAFFLLGGVAALAVMLAGARREPQPRWIWAAVLFGGVSLLSVLVNRVPLGKAMDGLASVLPFVAVGALASRLPVRSIQPMLGTLVGIGVLLAGYGVVSFMAFRAAGGHLQGFPDTFPPAASAVLYPYLCGVYPVPKGWRLISLFLNENYLGVWLAMVAPVTWAWAGTMPQGRARYWVRVAAGLMLVCFTWTYSRMAVVAMAGALAVCWLRVSRSVWLLLVPILLAVPLFLSVKDTYRFTHVEQSDGGRIYSVQRTASTLRTNPWLGTGPGTRGLADMNYAKVGYETGWLGLGAFLLLIGGALAPGLKRPTGSAEARALSGALLAALAGVALAAVGGEVWENPQLAFTFWLFVGLLWRLSTADSAGLAPSGRPRPNAGTPSA